MILAASWTVPMKSLLIWVNALRADSLASFRFSTDSGLIFRGIPIPSSPLGVHLKVPGLTIADIHGTCVLRPLFQNPLNRLLGRTHRLPTVLALDGRHLNHRLGMNLSLSHRSSPVGKDPCRAHPPSVPQDHHPVSRTHPEAYGTPSTPVGCHAPRPRSFPETAYAAHGSSH